MSLTDEEKMQFLRSLLSSGVNINQVNLGGGTVNYGTINNYASNGDEFERHTPKDDALHEEGNTSDPVSDEDLRIRKAVEAGITDKNFSGGKDWAMIRIALEEITGECFSSTTHFLRHMSYLGFENLPTQSTIDRLYSKIGGNSQGGYRFGDGADAHVATIRTNIAKEVIGAYNRLG